MRFEKDILISYAHIDDAPLIEGQKGWISEFHRSLEIRLSQLLGKKPRIWRDPKLQGNDHFSDEILDQLSRIALLISVLSPRYVQSEWCMREVSTFCEVSSRSIGTRINNKSRVFKIIKTPVRRDEHPETIRDLLGYEFFKRDPDTGRAKELSRIFGADNEQAYWQKLDDLAHDISELLGTLSEDGKDPVINPVAKKTVYLAEATSDMQEYRAIMKRELQQHGYEVLPDQMLPLLSDNFTVITQQLLTQSIMSVHMVGSNYGIVPEGTDKSIIVLQNDLAGDQSLTRNLQRLIWIAPDSKPEDLRQSDFITSLKTDTRAQVGADLLTTSLEEAKLSLLHRLAHMHEDGKENMGSEADSNGLVRMYVVCDQSDLDSVSLSALSDFLFQQGCEVILPVFDGDEAQVRIEHQESLKACTGVIICFGAAGELWLRSKLRDLLKIAGYGRTTPLLCKAVFLMDSVTPQKERFRSHEVMVINGLGGFKADLIQTFVRDVKKQVKTSGTI